MAPMQKIYKEVKGCIVAFIQKYIPVQDGSHQPPMFPPIIGTGFAIRDEGGLARPVPYSTHKDILCPRWARPMMPIFIRQ